ncbi:MAG TPA: proline dehydrogenase [Flavobacteriales bacterium]|nr:proline dehydrogenase [Flavobacteriales bacterium]
MVSFDNTEIAFSGKSDGDLNRAYLLFKLIGNNSLVNLGKTATQLAIRLYLPIEGMVKATIFKQFCGGTDLKTCDKTINELAKFHIGTILNYSAEGNETEKDFARALNEVLSTIDLANQNPKIPFCVFKVTGIARFGLLEKASAHSELSESEKQEYELVEQRVDKICRKAEELGVRVLIDAEESWIQQAIDDLVTNAMRRYNTQKPLIYNTVQMYRSDRLQFLKSAIAKAGSENYFLGIKLVRGAYMEKERERAAAKNYDSPIHATKENTDIDYASALKILVENNAFVATCAGTHNEKSCQDLINMMEKQGIDKTDRSIYFAQLLGMSDQISYNLASAGFNIAKFVPYGPVKEVIPYLIRRAEENTSIAGQISRELSLIMQEKNRRKSNN